MSRCACQDCAARRLRLAPAAETVHGAADDARFSYMERTFGVTRDRIDSLILAERGRDDAASEENRDYSQTGSY